MKALNIEIKKILTTKDYDGYHYSPSLISVEGKDLRPWRHDCRTVFKLGNEVIKFEEGVTCELGEDSRWDALHGQCLQELSFFTGQLRQEHKKYFATILEAGIVAYKGIIFVYIRQEYIRPSKHEFRKEHTDILDSLIYEYGFTDLSANVNCKIDHCGNLKIFDFAL